MKTFELNAENVYARIDEAVKNPEGILNNYQPSGISIKDKQINGNQIQFMATKSVLGISRTVFYKGVLDINEIAGTPTDRCFQADLDFTGSGELIINNVQKLELVLCVSEKSTDHLAGTVKPKLFKGNDFGGLLGNVAKNLVIDQIDPMIAAVKQEVESPR